MYWCIVYVYCIWPPLRFISTATDNDVVADNNTDSPRLVGSWFPDKFWKGGWQFARANGVTNEPPRRELKPPDWLYLRARALTLPALQIIIPFCFIFWSFCGAGCPIQSPEMFIKMSPIYSIAWAEWPAGVTRTVLRGLRQASTRRIRKGGETVSDTESTGNCYVCMEPAFFHTCQLRQRWLWNGYIPLPLSSVTCILLWST